MKAKTFLDHTPEEDQEIFEDNALNSRQLQMIRKMEKEDVKERKRKKAKLKQEFVY